MSFVFSIKDTYRQAVEAASGGKNTVMYDSAGNPSIMVVVPKFKISDVISGGSASTHPAFIVNGVEKDAIYISKFQNIVYNNMAYSVPSQDPATYVNFDQARTYAANKGAGWHLMTNAEWAAIALWCKANGFMPRGNNNYGADTSAPYEKGRVTYTYGTPATNGRVATGSGPKSWAHDDSNEGIFDLNGNINEWVGGLRLNNGEIQVIQDNNAADNTVDQSSTSTAWQAINLTDGSYTDGTLVPPGTTGSAKYDSVNAGTTGDVGAALFSDTIVNSNAPASGDDGYLNSTFETLAAKSGITVPEIAKALGLFPVDSSEGGDGYWIRNYGERLPSRGGFWTYGSQAGVFYLNLNNPRSSSINSIGFRAAFC